MAPISARTFMKREKPSSMKAPSNTAMSGLLDRTIDRMARPSSATVISSTRPKPFSPRQAPMISNTKTPTERIVSGRKCWNSSGSKTIVFRSSVAMLSGLRQRI